MTDAAMMEKTYDPRATEPEIYQMWEQAGAFSPDPNANPDAPTYTIVIPPPNVTGALHLGHALNNTLQDILIRYHRMRGFNTLWQPGTDHAGIATQAVVEKRLKQDENKTRHDLGREELVRRIWTWKSEYEQRILNQLRLMGCSCDWQRTRFTLDDGLAAAVRQQFFNMFKDGLIFRGKRLVNWDTQLQTAVSDDEVYYELVKGHFWHFNYPVIDPKPGEPEHVTIATTRPETMLGDTAVAVHPDPEGFVARQEEQLRATIADGPAKDRDEAQAKLDVLAQRRTTHLNHLIKLRDMANDGRMLMLPLVERPIPLIADEWADPTKGSGCVKITPAHDPNDYEVGLRNDLPQVNVLAADGNVAPIVEPDGSLNPHSGTYEGLAFTTEARDKVVADLDARGLLGEVEDHEVEIGHSDRSKLRIEPYLSDQWFLKTADVDDGGITLGDGAKAPGLAQSAISAVEDGNIEVFPSRYAKSYLDWLGEKRDWCISRQLWWGHRIPVWTSPTGERIDSGVEMGERACADEFGNVCVRSDDDQETINQVEGKGLAREEDVLDTWFSSALWPFSTLGWPEQTAHLKRYYPGSVLCTSRDIITNWVARMVMFGMYSMGKIPFDHVYIHPKILDGRGETMSKSKGNGVDPVDIINTHGADALRYAMADMTTETQDIRMPVEYLCPHCGKLTDQALALKAETQARKSRGEKIQDKIQPSDCHRVTCTDKACGKEYATQWAPQAIKDELPIAHETSDKFDIGRNFCNKLWNAARFAFMNLEGTTCTPLDIKSLPPEDRWILAKLSETIRNYHEAIGKYQFAASVQELREFFWDSLCDWYIELTKPRLSGQSPAGADAAHSSATAKQVLAFCVDQILRLWHPTIPFITERLWQQFGKLAPKRGLPGIAELETDTALIVAPFPPVDGHAALADEHIVHLFGEIQNVVRGVRELRSSCDVSPKQKVDVTVALPEEDRAAFETQAHIVIQMANVNELTVDPSARRPANAGSVTMGSLRVFVHDITDDQAERKRTEKALADVTKQIKGKESKLGNEKFVANAKPEIVEAERQRLADLLEQRTSLEQHMKELSE